MPRPDRREVTTRRARFGNLGSHRGPVPSASSSASRQWAQGRTFWSFRGGEGSSHRCRRIVMDRLVFLGRARVRAYPSRRLPRIRCQVLRTLLRAGGAEGEEAVGLQPQERRPGRPDPSGRGAQAALAKHRGDRRRRDVDAKVQELASDPEVAPPDSLTAVGCQAPPRAALTARLAASTMSRGEGRLGTALRARETCPERTW